jgi:hypothetical protein
MSLNFLNMTEKELDGPIYRIMKEEHVIRLFIERRNVLSQIHNWKDKFENFQMAMGGDLPLNFHPAGTGALWVDTPIGAG